MIDQRPDGSLAGLTYIETDFTNTPRFLRRAAGDLTQPVWSWPIAPYGDTPALEDRDGDGARIVFNPRSPGQYYDAFSGLHYNHTRYFSPRTGRYLQPDLIGLEGVRPLVTMRMANNGDVGLASCQRGAKWEAVQALRPAIYSTSGKIK